MPRSARYRGAKRFLKYVAIRTALIAFSLVVAIYLVVFVANLGGELDKIVYTEVKSAVTNRLIDPVLSLQLRGSCEAQCINATSVDRCISECIDSWIESETRIILKQMGIDPDQPSYIRLLGHYRRVLVLDLGEARRMHSDITKSKRVIDIIAEALPLTILLFTTANIIIFFTNISIGLFLSRRYGTVLDKIAISLTPLSSMPGWFYGMVLLLTLGIWYKIFPSGGWISENPPEDPILRALDVAYHMVLPILSWMLASVPIGAYSYRTFFLLFSTEEYVEYAKARGIPETTVLRRYVLRPTLPPIITNFALMLIGSWMGAIITESIFSWPGLGTKLATAIGDGINIDSPVIVGINAIYAYLLAITVLVLDIVYGILDPRVRVVGE